MRSMVLALYYVIAAWSDASADQPAYLATDLADLTDQFAQLWSNDRQVFFAREAGYDVAAELLSPMTFRLSPIEGVQHTFHLETSGDHTHSARFVTRFSIGDPDGSIQQSVDGSDCRIAWTRRAGGFHGSGSDACGALFKPEVSELAGPVDLILNKAALSVSFGGASDAWNAEFRAARSFTCWAAVLRGSVHGESGEGRDDWMFRSDAGLHDQGGVAMITTDESPPRSIRLQLRDVDWPYGNRRSSLTLYVYEGDDERAVSYAWTEAGAERIGINLRWIQVSCTAD